ncbi:TPA: DinI-like family protein [Citrobacter gillenii]
MFVELVYDKRNFDGLPGAKDIILGELTKRVHRIFPDADVRVKPMMTLQEVDVTLLITRSRNLPACMTPPTRE